MGKYNLHHIGDRVLFGTPDIKINKGNGHVQSIPTNRHLHITTGHALNSEHV